MSEAVPDLHRPRGEYGYDGDYRLIPAPVVAAGYAAVCAALAAFAVVSIVGGATLTAVLTGGGALLLIYTGASFVRLTRVGKFEVWARILTELRLRGNERVLDVGCGRGAVLLTVAKLLPRGRAVGVDLWRADQTGNSRAGTLRNAELEGVSDRVEVHTGDMTRLPFEDESFEVIVSSLAVHNVPGMAGRLAAIDEAVRVLRPGGRLRIVDIGFTKRYAARLRELGVEDVRRRNLGWRFWWGGPWFPTHLVSGTKTG